MPHPVSMVLFPKIINKLDNSTNRPLAGFAVFNESSIILDDGKVKSQIDTFVHEVIHALYFDPNLFKAFPNNKNGDSFHFQDSDGVFKIRGDNILEQTQKHFGCDTLESGILIIYSSFGRWWRRWICRRTFREAYFWG